MAPQTRAHDSYETEPGELLSRGGPPINRRKPIFDPTINLGHILTFVGACGVGLMAFNSVTTKLAISEQRQTMLEDRVREQDARTKESFLEIKADMKTMQRTLDDIKSNVSQGGKR